MPKFRLVEGTHKDGPSGREYKKGDLVDSPHDLAATFRGKFVPADPAHYHPPDRLAPLSDNPTSAPGFTDDPAQRTVSAEPQAAGGAPPDRLPPATPTEQLGRGHGSEDEDPSGADFGPNAAQNASKAPGEPEGTDVTDRFPKAKEQDYKVYKRTSFNPPDEGVFFLYDADDLSKPVGHGLKRGDVDAAVEKAVKTE